MNYSPQWVKAPTDVLIYQLVHLILSLFHQIAALSARDTDRLGAAYAQFTASAYNQKFRTFIAFCCFASVSLTNISTKFLLAFLEFFTFNHALSLA